MGNTTVDYQGQEFWVPEGALAVSMYLVGSQIAAEADPAWLTDLRADWLLQATSD